MEKFLSNKFILGILANSIAVLLSTNPAFTHKHIMKSGINMGIEMGNIAHKGSLTGSGKRQAINVKAFSPNVGLFLGYNHKIDSSYFAGLEIYAKNQNAEYVKSFLMQRNVIKNSVSMKNSFGSNFILGINKSGKSFFIKVGYVHTNFKLKIDLKNKLTIQEKQSKGGILTGIGFDYSLTDNWSVGVIYDQIWYNKIKFNKKFEGSYEPNVHNVSCRLKYSF